MKKIWKYKIPLHGEFELELPEESELMCIMEQDGAPHMWMSLPGTNQHTRKYKYKILLTGEEYNEDRVGKYIGSFQLNAEHKVDNNTIMKHYVGHLFRKGY